MLGCPAAQGLFGLHDAQHDDFCRFWLARRRMWNQNIGALQLAWWKVVCGKRWVCKLGAFAFCGLARDLGLATTMNESALIDVLAAWLRAIGVSVDLHAFDLHHGGLYRSETREIFLNLSNAERALLTLAHEAGHHIGYVLAGHDAATSVCRCDRVRQAYVYGWRVLQLIGADALISRNRWTQECREDHRRWVEVQRIDRTPSVADD